MGYRTIISQQPRPKSAYLQESPAYEADPHDPNVYDDFENMIRVSRPPRLMEYISAVQPPVKKSLFGLGRRLRNKPRASALALACQALAADPGEEYGTETRHEQRQPQSQPIMLYSAHCNRDSRQPQSQMLHGQEYSKTATDRARPPPPPRRNAHAFEARPTPDATTPNSSVWSNESPRTSLLSYPSRENAATGSPGHRNTASKASSNKLRDGVAERGENREMKRVPRRRPASNNDSQSSTPDPQQGTKFAERSRQVEAFLEKPVTENAYLLLFFIIGLFIWSLVKEVI